MRVNTSVREDVGRSLYPLRLFMSEPQDEVHTRINYNMSNLHLRLWTRLLEETFRDGRLRRSSPHLSSVDSDKTMMIHLPR